MTVEHFEKQPARSVTKVIVREPQCSQRWAKPCGKLLIIESDHRDVAWYLQGELLRSRVDAER